ncbi:REF/SRPP-like protein At3g05500 [Vitis riparia]|uniref:REF/SRPP-like protein At3g05500 n=1 Tax=Vitis riparia TaxID=96939 RepID=UPI00155A0DC5|nr:REF/SRPP-like protein At3g05500 [Vitis riparia]
MHGHLLRHKKRNRDSSTVSLSKLQYFHAVVCFSNLYGSAKERSGPLKLGIQTVERMVKIVVAPIYNKFHDVPFELFRNGTLSFKACVKLKDPEKGAPPVARLLNKFRFQIYWAGSLAANCIDNFVIFVNSGEASKDLEIDTPELESLFSAAAPKSDHRNSNGKSNLHVPARSKFDKVQLIKQ